MMWFYCQPCFVKRGHSLFGLSPIWLSCLCNGVVVCFEEALLSKCTLEEQDKAGGGSEAKTLFTYSSEAVF